MSTFARVCFHGQLMCFSVVLGLYGCQSSRGLWKVGPSFHAGTHLDTGVVWVPVMEASCSLPVSLYRHCWPHGSLSQFSAVTGQISTCSDSVICVSSVKASPTYIPDSDLIHDLREHLGAGLREGPVQLAGGVDGVPGTDEGSDKTVIRPVSWDF